MGLPITYSLIPTRRKRIETFSRIRSVLAPTGRCLIDFYVKPSAKKEHWVHQLKKALAYVSLGNRECQLGDTLFSDLLFIHFFQNLNEIEEEAQGAGFQIERLDFHHARGGYAILTPAA